MKTYTVRYKKDESDWWTASIKDVAGCHTQGRTIDQCRKRIRETLGFFVDDAERVRLIDDIVLTASRQTYLM